MSRKRYGAVLESRADLLRLIDQRVDTQDEARLRFLLELEARPDANLSEIAQRIGYSDRQVRRWWSEYCNGGLSSLLTAAAPTLTNGSSSADPAARLLRFFNSMPLTTELRDWVEQFTNAITELFEDVNSCLVAVELSATIHKNDSVNLYAGGKARLTTVSGVNPAKAQHAIRTGVVRSSPGELFIEHAIADGLPAQQYHPPRLFDYYHDDLYIGSIALWRLRTEPAISEHTVAVMNSIESFLKFALIDCIARAQEGRRDLFHFQNCLKALGNEAKLGRREMDVFALQVEGLPRSVIAEQLCISESTVSKHITSIHRKIGTHNYIEAFGRLFLNRDASFDQA